MKKLEEMLREKPIKISFLLYSALWTFYMWCWPWWQLWD